MICFILCVIFNARFRLKWPSLEIKHEMLMEIGDWMDKHSRKREGGREQWPKRLSFETTHNIAIGISALFASCRVGTSRERKSCQEKPCPLTSYIRDDSRQWNVLKNRSTINLISILTCFLCCSPNVIYWTFFTSFLGVGLNATATRKRMLVKWLILYYLCSEKKVASLKNSFRS